jgi:hypothetical protein
MNYSMCNCRYTHICYTVVINTRNELTTVSLLGLLMKTLMTFTLCTITRVEYVAAEARLMKCPYGVCTVRECTSGVLGREKGTAA